jgi:hypothetical protein
MKLFPWIIVAILLAVVYGLLEMLKEERAKKLIITNPEHSPENRTSIKGGEYVEFEEKQA